jgi:hypothetical protein
MIYQPILAVPVIPTGLSDDSTHPSIGGITTILLLVFVITFLIIRKRKKNQSENDTLTYHEKPVSFTRTNYTSNTEIQSADDFIDYACTYAQTNNCPKESPPEVIQFFMENFESLRLGYVFETRRPLLLNNIPSTINKAASKYLSTQNE